MPLLLDLFLTFAKIGLFTFGGGYAMLPLILEEVEVHKWMAQEALIDFIAVSESTPGPIIVNLATYVGSSQAGLLGAILATFAVVFPSSACRSVEEIVRCIIASGTEFLCPAFAH